MAFEVMADPAALAYANVATADAAAAFRIDGDAWIDLDDEDKLKHLILASRDLDTVDFIGSRASTTQVLEWPRTGTDYSGNAWPQRLVDATIALAADNAKRVAADATADLLTATTSDIKVEQVGPIRTEFFDRGAAAATALERFPAFVQRLIAPLVRSAVAAGWGSATVSRTS